MFFNNKLVLASKSRSRFRLLKNTGLLLIKKTPNCNEEKIKKKLLRAKINHKNISLELARAKAKSVSLKTKDILVVGSDTIISLNKTMLNKAKNLCDAKRKIKNMSGKKHYIYSSVSIFYNSNEVWHKTQKTTVKIRDLSEKEIQHYLRKTGKKILDSVGCYHIESYGPTIIENIKGDFFNVMGFPLFPFLKFLKKFNIKK